MLPRSRCQATAPSSSGNLWKPLARGGGHEQYTLCLRSYEGCDETGDKCNGHLDHANTVEWPYCSNQGEVSINLSNGMATSPELTTSPVDGYNMPVALEFGRNSTCKPRACQIYSEDLRSSGRLKTYWRSMELLIACRTAHVPVALNAAGELLIGPNECAPSNMYLKSMCKWSYAYAYDDTIYQSCFPDTVFG
jgi:hypothetical protein